MFTFNGIDAATGEPLLPSMTAAQLSLAAQGKPMEVDPGHLRALLTKARRKDVRGPRLVRGVGEGIDPKDLAQTGWGVIFAGDPDPAVLEALRPLLDHRKAQASKKKESYYREYKGTDGYQAGESKSAFLTRQGVGTGPANPEKVPYYLLLVGDPETIPYRFQYQLDVTYGVGRIHFETPEEYARYAESVVRAETTPPALPREAVFFGVRNPNDEPTRLSTELLLQPLATWAEEQIREWSFTSVVGEPATKVKLATLLGGTATPSLLFTASHGMGYREAGDPRQALKQGALICQEWPGSGAVGRSHFFAAEDVPDTAAVHGLISFHFACYGAGTPRVDSFPAVGTSGRQIAKSSFVAALPKRLLSHPKGGALAVIGHVDKAWEYSYITTKKKQLEVFQSALRRLFSGHPVGSALDYFNARYAELSSDLLGMQQDIREGATPKDDALAELWLANNDAQSYAIVGDPAARLPGAKA
jgi:Peptidase family C25